MNSAANEIQLKNALRQRLVQRLASGTPDLLVPEALLPLALELLGRLGREGYSVPVAQRLSLAEAVVDDVLGYGPLQPLLEDPAVSEIMVNGHAAVFVERRGRKDLVDCRFDDEAHLRYHLEKLVRAAGRRLDEASPFLDLLLPDGSRVNAIIPPAVLGGPHLTIRRFSRQIDSLERLVALGTLCEPLARFLRACVVSGQNMLCAGATGAGKTTLLEVLSRLIPPTERIVTIEDTPELQLTQPNVARLLTRPPNLEGRGEITPGELFANCLRMRPSRILVGELRGREAAELLQAVNSGHRGTLAVIHAATPEQALLRLEHLALLALGNVPLRSVRSMVAAGLQLVVQVALLPDGVRRVTHLAEVRPPRGEDPPEVVDLYSWDPAGGGRFVTHGVVPRFVEELGRVDPRLADLLLTTRAR